MSVSVSYVILGRFEYLMDFLDLKSSSSLTSDYNILFVLKMFIGSSTFGVSTTIYIICSVALTYGDLGEVGMES